MADLLMPQAQIDADREGWLELRRGGITGTDIATILGHSSYDSPFALWHRKKGNLPGPVQTDRMRLGTVLEEYVAQRWRESQTEWTVGGGGLWGDGWRLATVDRTLHGWFSFTEGAPVGVLECKTVGSWQGWGAAGSGEVPPGVRAQALWGADVLGVPVAHVAALNRTTGEFRSYVLDRGCVMADGLSHGCESCAERARWMEAGEKFLTSLRSGTPPPVDGAEATAAALRALHVPVAERRAAVPLETWSQWRKARAMARETAAEAKCWDARMRDALGDAETGVVGDLDVVRRRITPRAGYTVAPGTQDKLEEIKEK